MFRVIKESEYVDERQHCFLIQVSISSDVDIKSNLSINFIELWYQFDQILIISDIYSFCLNFCPTMLLAEFYNFFSIAIVFYLFSWDDWTTE